MQVVFDLKQRGIPNERPIISAEILVGKQDVHWLQWREIRPI